MKPYRRYRNLLEMWLASHKGKRVLNLFYSWGAAFVILGALFHFLHLPYANVILFVSLMVEFCVFFISGFERPTIDYSWEEVFPELASTNPMDKQEMQARREYLIAKAKQAHGQTQSRSARASAPGVAPASSAQIDLIPEQEMQRLSDSITALGEAAQQLARIGQVSGQMMDSYQAMASDYEALSRGSEEYLRQIESLARNVAGLNTIYEIQLKGISSQIEAIDRINSGLHSIKEMYAGTVADSSAFRAENERMAQQLAQLNLVYARMLDALTGSMGTPGMPQQPYRPSTDTIHH